MEAEFVQRSIERKIFKTRRNWGIVIVVFVILSGLTIYAFIQQQNSELSHANSLGRYSLSLLGGGRGLDAGFEAIKAGKILQTALLKTTPTHW